MDDLTMMMWATHDSDPAFVLGKMYEQGRAPKGLADLHGVQQCSTWHPEGCAYTHTLHVCNAMRDICVREGVVGERRRMFMFAALTHDFGKVSTTRLREKNGVSRWTSYGHDQEGVPLAEAFLRSIDAGPFLLERVPKLVRRHMSHLTPAVQWTDASVRRLADRLAPSSVADLLLLMEADCNGRPPLPKGLPPSAGVLAAAAERLGVLHGPTTAGV